MKRGLIGALLATLGLAGCEDDYTITRVNQYNFDRSLITASGAVPTEIHGQPLIGLNAERALSLLRMPHSYPNGVRFHRADPDARRRLILVFNGGVPDDFAMCRERREATTSAPAATGFTVAAAFCTADQPRASGYMEVRDATAEDPEKFTRVMRSFFMNVFEEDRD